ncbi:MAG: hypothetical protein WBP38_03340 [Hyphomicrobium sp.]|nr:hypothetical protein [Hyphomicrobium sp.]
MGPDLQTDVNLLELAAYAVLNPATVAVSFWIGRQANEKQKIWIAAFAGALAGIVLIYFAALLQIWDAPQLGRAGGGIFAASLVAGLLYGWIGHATRK